MYMGAVVIQVFTGTGVVQRYKFSGVLQGCRCSTRVQE
jgi:hypothetical protein